MARVLLSFDDYVVTDTGEVVVEYKSLEDRLRRGETIGGLTTKPHPDIALYNSRNRENPIRVVEIDGTPGTFPAHLYDWKTPQDYQDTDLSEYVVARLFERFADPPAEYIDRVQTEIDMMCERGMEDFLRLLIYISERLQDNQVVRGIGRGSACASLVLNLIGIHMVDPIEYDIPISEFLR